ncbi:MAG: hypothetical protein JRH20_27930, partial [Deltaproteobacteria bacterium]|nr:hypothetical protein [Deltaproteobacteria bacterium]
MTRACAFCTALSLTVLMSCARMGGDHALSELGVSELGVSELGVSELGVSELGVSELGVSELGVSELGVPTLALRVTDVRAVGETLHPGQRGVEIIATLFNDEAEEIFLVDAELSVEPAGALKAWVERDTLPHVPPGGSAELHFWGEVQPLAEPQTLLVWPRVRAVSPLRPGAAMADVSEGPWALRVGAAGPALVVNTVADDLDGPEDMDDPTQAGETLSLREALTLINNGYAITRVEFDAFIFAPGKSAQIVFGSGTAGASMPPGIVAADTEIDAFEREVTLTTAPELNGGPLITIQAPRVTLRGLRLHAPGSPLSAQNADDLVLDELVLTGGLVNDNDLVLLQSSDRALLRAVRVENGTPISLRSSQQVRCEGLDLSAGGNFSIEDSPHAAIIDSSFSSLGFSNSPGSTLYDSTIAPQRSLTIDRSTGVILHGVQIARRGDDKDSAVIKLISSEDVQLLELDYNATFGPMIQADTFSNVGATRPLIEVLNGTTLSGSAAIPDKSRIDLYQWGSDSSGTWQRFVGESVAQSGRFEFKLPNVVSPNVFYRATATTAGLGTSMPSALFRAPQPSLCISGTSLFRNSFESAEMDHWQLDGDVVRRSGSAAMDGAGYLGTIHSNTG